MGGGGEGDDEPKNRKYSENKQEHFHDGQHPVKLYTSVMIA